MRSLIVVKMKSHKKKKMSFNQKLAHTDQNMLPEQILDSKVPQQQRKKEIKKDYQKKKKLSIPQMNFIQKATIVSTRIMKMMKMNTAMILREKHEQEIEQDYLNGNLMPGKSMIWLLQRK